jgi:outer membrane biosynthesis protein TonB
VTTALPAAQRPQGARLALPLGVSLVLHVSAALGLLLGVPRSSGVSAPVYSVNLVAAPAGERAVGVVTETPVPTPEPTPPPKRAETKPAPMKAPAKAPPVRKAPAKATPTPDAKSSRADKGQRAGGGPTGGKGADVANVRTEGIAFPFPSYLENIVRQIALRFKPRNPGALHAELVFLIRRDGSITGLQLRQRSGSYAFDLEAMGAVEAAANSFGPLPDGFSDDVLTVIFSFDPQLIR